MTLQELILEYKKNHGVSYDWIAQQTGVTKSTVSRWASGEIKKLQEETMQHLSALLGTDLELLLAEKGNYQKPIIGVVKAGYDWFAEQNILGYEAVTEREYWKGNYFLKVKGNSMIGAKIHDGDLIYVRSCSDVNSGEIAIVLINGDEATVKRVIKKNQMIILEAANAEVATRYYSMKEAEELPIQIIGKVLYSKTMFD